jgi:colanic acid/amylovoran biosynthesis protein
LAGADANAAARARGALFWKFWRAKAALLRGKYSAGRTFLNEFENSDAVLLAGCGLLNDHFVKLSLEVLRLLELALNSGKPVALLSQGIGPMETPDLRQMAGRVLPRVESIFVREERTTPALLNELGIGANRITFTGDDAVALAYRQRSEQPGTELGFNLRVSSYSAASEQTLAVVSRVLADKSKQYGVCPLGIPIARGNRECDVKTAERLLAGLQIRGDAGQEADTPEKTIERVARCRLVLTGSYHAAVFALAQGIPAVCVAENLYYENKFLGLTHSFGEGCAVVLARNDFSKALAKTVDELWCKADHLRPMLLREAERQVRMAESAYASLFSKLSDGESVPRSTPAVALHR